MRNYYRISGHIPIFDNIDDRLEKKVNCNDRYKEFKKFLKEEFYEGLKHFLVILAMASVACMLAVITIRNYLAKR